MQNRKIGSNSLSRNRSNLETLVLGAVLTALVVILQFLGQFIHLGPFSISLVLIPIVIGAATCGPYIGGWLGLVFGLIVLVTDAGLFLAIDVVGTVITVLVKGVACGLAAGIVYKLAENVNTFFAIILAAIICPIVNTGVFLLGCFVFFFETIKEWGLSSGYENVAKYMIFGFVGANFIFELVTNIILSTPAVMLLKMIKTKK